MHKVDKLAGQAEEKEVLGLGTIKCLNVAWKKNASMEQAAL